MKKMGRWSNLIFGIAMIYSIGVMIKVYYDKTQVPAGTCPVTNNSTLVYSAIGVLLLSVIVTTIIESKMKKSQKK